MVLALGQDGEPFRAKRVIVATGIAPFAWRRPQFSTLPRTRYRTRLSIATSRNTGAGESMLLPFPFTRS